MTLDRAALHLPRSRTEILRIQSERKRIALDRALQAPFLRERLGRVNRDRLDDPDEWARSSRHGQG